MSRHAPARGGHLRLLAVAAALRTVATTAPPAAATFPDQNGRITFRRFLNQDRTWGAMFTIKPNGKGEQQVTFPSPGFPYRDPDYSRAGRKIVFQREGETSSEIWVVDADGSHLTQLTNPDPGCRPEGGTCDGSPSWSPDGQQIAFNRDTGTIEGENKGVWVMNADGTAAHQLTQLDQPGQGFDRAPQLSPDGHQLLFERDNVPDARPVDNGVIRRSAPVRRSSTHRAALGDAAFGRRTSTAPTGDGADRTPPNAAHCTVLVNMLGAPRACHLHQSARCPSRRGVTDADRWWADVAARSWGFR